MPATSHLSYRLFLQQRALARPELNARSRAFHFESARSLAARIIGAGITVSPSPTEAKAPAPVVAHPVGAGRGEGTRWVMCPETDQPCSVCPTRGIPCSAQSAGAGRGEGTRPYWDVFDGVTWRCTVRAVSARSACATAKRRFPQLASRPLLADRARCVSHVQGS